MDVVDDSLEGLQSAFRALSVEEVDTDPVKRKRERKKGWLWVWMLQRLGLEVGVWWL